METIRILTRDDWRAIRFCALMRGSNHAGYDHRACNRELETAQAAERLSETAYLRHYARTLASLIPNA